MKIVKKQFVFDDPTPTPECHASTVVKATDGSLIAAWFGGERESRPDVMIWVSRYENGKWSTPVTVSKEEGIPHWNPVLFMRDDNTVCLFYKVGFYICDWQTMVVESKDSGKSWSEPYELIAGDFSGGRGPVKNKPIYLSNGTILAPGSVERGPWRCFVDIQGKDGAWVKKDIPVNADVSDTNVIQPTLWEYPKGHLHALLRSNKGYIYRSDSVDFGESWCDVYPTDIPNNNSGIDCVRTDDGRIVLVCNPNPGDFTERSPLSVFVSKDNGSSFTKAFDIETESGEFSYPSVVSDKNKVYVVYTWKRKKIAFCEIEL